MNHVILMGPQGAGKGTQADRVAPILGLSHLSTGEMFRAAVTADTDLGRLVKEYLDGGNLVPDDVTLQIVDERLQTLSVTGFGGALLDGFPRTPEQAAGLDARLARRGDHLARVVEVTAPRAVLVARLSGRRVCPVCGSSYHVEFHPPRVDLLCDRDGTSLIQRADDTPEAIEQRLALYDSLTAPLLNYYREQGLVRTIDGNASIEDVTARIITAIGMERAA